MTADACAVLDAALSAALDAMAALEKERDAAVRMLAAGVEAYLGSGDMRFWAMGAEAMVNQLAPQEEE